MNARVKKCRTGTGCLLGMVLLLASCTFTPPMPDAASMRRFDLGPLAPAAASLRPWRVDVRADDSLAEEGMRYRLLYVNPAEVRVYSRARWAEAPADVLRGALESRLLLPLTAPENFCQLSLNLLRFEQEFLTSTSSRGVLTVRATLRQGGNLVDERHFDFMAPTASADAEGGVAALADAAQQLATTLLDWRLQHAERCGRRP